MLQEKYEKEKKRPFDFIILAVALVINLIGITIYSYDGLIFMAVAAVIGVAVMIWHFMKDPDYKFQYFAGYLVCNFILKKITEFLSEMVYSSAADLIILIIISFIGAFSYQFFKIMSYKKLLNN